MATKLYLKSSTNNGVSGTGDGVVYDMNPTAGGSVDTDTVSLTNGGTEIQWTQTAGGSTVAWITPPFAEAVTLTTADFSAWFIESNMNDEVGGRIRLFKYSGGSVTEIGGGPFDDGVEFGTTITEMTWTANFTDTAFAVGDRLLLRVYAVPITTMTAGTADIQFAAADAATGDSFLNVNEDIRFQFTAIENWNSYSDGSIDSLNGGTNWSTAWSVGTNDLLVQGTTVYEGAKAAALTSAAGVNPFHTRNFFSHGGKMTTYIAIRRSSTSTGELSFTLRNTINGSRVAIRLNASGNLTMIGTTTVTLITGYTANQWYVVRIKTDEIANTATAAYSTGAYQSGGSYSTESSSVTMSNSGAINQVGLGGDGGSTIIYDLITGVDPMTAAASGPTNLKTWDGIAKASVKTINGIAIASIKSVDGIT